jgi:hypothetical protein
MECLPDLQRLFVELERPGGAEPGNGQPEQCVSYLELCGRAEVGDTLLVNTTAVDLDLGTGGWHYALANLTRSSHDPYQVLGPEGGHIIKLRYTPLQFAVDAWESDRDTDDPEPTSLEGLPVVICPLHSHLAPAVVAADARVTEAKGRRPCIAYLMGDTAALPMAFSDQVRALRCAGYQMPTITWGQAFGGDFEAITLASALIAAKHLLGADLAIVAQGPGNPGAGGPFGCAATSVADAVNSTAALRGRAIVAPRVSFADPRPRHQGISHHTLTALSILTLARATVAMPTLDPVRKADLADSMTALSVKHEMVSMDAAPLLCALRESPVPLRSMGRTLEDDPLFFLAPAAAGAYAASLV